jgi:hypothetical protein
MTTRRDFTQTLSEQDHNRLLIALDAAALAIGRTRDIATQGGELDDARDHIAAAMTALRDVDEVLRVAPALP